ncbi:MAG: glucose-6-phosphate isomerase [Candidatus Zixiibacteriota bacterium]
MKNRSSLEVTAGPIAKEFNRLLSRGVKTQLVPRIMGRDAAVFTTNAATRKLIVNRLGWTDVASSMRGRVVEIERFGRQVFADGIRHVVLAGMGGSSLCPEVFKLMFGKHPKLASFDVLDATDPVAVGRLALKLDLHRSLFIIASKSGGTIETRSHEAFFLDLLAREGIRNIGKHFVAITDKGSNLEKFARRRKYRKVFVNPSDIGGRYSALSFFGLVPGFLAGVDLTKLLVDAVSMENILRERIDESNPALILGAALAAGARGGRDKLTFRASSKAAPLIPWIEQLIAESTGKKGKGIVPIEAEPMLDAKKYGKDRVFVALRMAGERPPVPGSVGDLLPRLDLVIGDRSQLGSQFLLWEAATAVAGYSLDINPFDEPNVTESKENTKRILAGLEKTGRFPFDRAGDMIARHEHEAVRVIRKHLRSIRPPAYVTFLCYFPSDKNTEDSLAKIRGLVSGRTKVATLRGYGPRYLHSIGQLYKGGPKEGLFVVLLREEYSDLVIPGQSFGFGQLIRAQALGDAQALIKRKFPTLVLAIDGEPADGLKSLLGLVRKALN